MDRIRFIVFAVLAGGLLYWLYPSSGPASSGDETEVTIWFNGIVFGRHYDAVDAFERAYPQYKAIVGSSAVRTGLEGEGNPQRLMCGIAGGVPPEVVEYDRFAICQWAARGAFKDLTPLIEKDLKELDEARSKLDALRQEANRGNASKELLDRLDDQDERVKLLERFIIRPSDYYPLTWGECQYAMPGTKTAGQYGVPNYMDNRVLYYNSDMLVQAGYADADGKPTPPRSWEDIIVKRADVQDATIADESASADKDRRYRVTSAAADFVAAGVEPGDILSHISGRGNVRRCQVAQVVDAHQLVVASAYSAKELRLPTGKNEHIKVFKADCYALRLTRWNDEGELKVVGFEPQHGNAWLYMYGWANGGRFMSEDGRTCTLNDPRIVEALQWTTDLYDALGGTADVNAFKKSFQADAQDPFLMGQIACFINGDWFMRDLVRYKRDMRFGTAPPPVPQKRIDEGEPYVSWVAGFALCIPSTCPEDKLDAAWALVKFLSSVEGGMVMNEHDAQRERAQGRLYISRQKANRKLNELQIKRYINIPEMPQRVKLAAQTHIDMMPYGHFRPVSPAGQVLWNAQADAQDAAWNHTMSPEATLNYETERVQRSLDKFYAKPANPTHVNWGLLVWGYLALLVAIGAAIWIRFKQRNAARGFYRREWYAGLGFALPWMIGFIVLSGGPMVFSAIMSFTEYDVINPATYVGLDNYREMFTIDWGGPDADGGETVPTGVRRSLLNTLYMAIGLPISMIIGLALAMLLDAKVRGLKYWRTFFFLPAIMPVVAASVLWIWVFNAHNGLLNYLLDFTGIERLLEWTGVPTPISWLTNKHTTKPALIIMTLWTAGASMIIWLAGLKDIPTHLYEAAAIDGAGPVRRFFRITLPLLSPYILFNLIIGLIQTFQIFTQAYIMTPNGSPERSTYFYVYKLFDECFSFFRLGYGAAMAWVLFILLIVLTLLNMQVSKKWVFYAGE